MFRERTVDGNATSNSLLRDFCDAALNATLSMTTSLQVGSAVLQGTLCLGTIGAGSEHRTAFLGLVAGVRDCEGRECEDGRLGKVHLGTTEAVK